MAVLVTGGYGFIGSWVVKLLAESGEDVVRPLPEPADANL